MKRQLAELEVAVREQRQPICVYCEQPLDCIGQVQPTTFYWVWDEETKQYYKDEELGDSDKPYCTNCDAADWDLIESGEATKALGLEY